MKYSDFLKLENINFDDDKSKRLLNGFIKQLKKDHILIYDNDSKEWWAENVYYGHLFVNYYMNKKERKPEKIDYKKHVIYKTFVNLFEQNRDLELHGILINISANWYENFIKEKIKIDIKNIALMNFLYNDKKVDLNWFDYHNLNCRNKFNNLVNDIDYPNFRFDSIYGNTKNNNNYIDEIILEPITIATYPKGQNFGYRVYSKLKDNKNEIVKVNEIYFNRNLCDESVEKKHRDKWIKIKENDNVAIINFKNSPYFKNKGYLKQFRTIVEWEQ